MVRSFLDGDTDDGADVDAVARRPITPPRLLDALPLLLLLLLLLLPS